MITVPIPAAETANPLSVGARLRAARLAQPLPLEDIANQLCIRAVHLRALENGDYAALPALVYARGFVRSYAEFLKIDPTPILTQFRLETADQEETLDPVLLPSSDQQQLPSKGLIIAAAVVVVLITILWSTVNTPVASDTAPLEVAGTTTDLMQNEGDGADRIEPSANAQLQVFAPVDTAPPAQSTPPIMTVTPPLTAPIVTVQPVSAAPATNPAPAPLAAPLAQATAANPVTPPVVVPNTGITLVAESDAWIEVTAPTGEVIFSRVLRTGQNYNLPERLYGSFLSTGNAGGLRVSLKGQNLGTLGKPGEVVNNIILDAAEIRSRAINPSL